MTDPQRPSQRLSWIRVVDFYHAASYLTKLADVLFAADKSNDGSWRRLSPKLGHVWPASQKLSH